MKTAIEAGVVQTDFSEVPDSGTSAGYFTFGVLPPPREPDTVVENRVVIGEVKHVVMFGGLESGFIGAVIIAFVLGVLVGLVA